MQQSLCAERDMCLRHFTDVFGGFANDQSSSHVAIMSDDINRLKRRPKCKTRNKQSDESRVRMCDDFCCKATLFAMPNLAVIVPDLTGGCDTDQLMLADTETVKFTDINVRRMEPLFMFDILCLSFQSSEIVTAHQATVLTRWFSRHQTMKTANFSLVQILMASKCPLVSHVCSRILKQSWVTSSTLQPSSVSSVAAADVISYVLFLQKEMVKYLETGQFSMNLVNVICLLDCITAACRNLLTGCNKLRFSSRLYSRWCSTDLRWAALAVVSLANVVSARIELTSDISSTAADADIMRSVREHVERVPQIVSTVLSTSVQCEVAQMWNVSRIVNEYWHTTDTCQRCLIVESVLVPKLRMELCTMILARHCDVLLHASFISSLSLDDLFSVFAENVLISAITQRMWVEDVSLSVIGHCQEICSALCNTVCSYILYQKETRGYLLQGDITVLQRLPDYVATVKKRLSEVCHGRNVLDVVSISALDRLSCLADVYSAEA